MDLLIGCDDFGEGRPIQNDHWLGAVTAEEKDFSCSFPLLKSDEPGAVGAGFHFAGKTADAKIMLEVAVKAT